MKISYAITVCNELDEITKLLNFLLKNRRKEDEIVVLFDKKNGHLKYGQQYLNLKMNLIHPTMLVLLKIILLIGKMNYHPTVQETIYSK